LLAMAYAVWRYDDDTQFYVFVNPI